MAIISDLILLATLKFAVAPVKAKAGPILNFAFIGMLVVCNTLLLLLEYFNPFWKYSRPAP